MKATNNRVLLMVLYMVRVLKKLPLRWVAQGQRRVSVGKEERPGTLSLYTSWGRSLHGAGAFICGEIRRNTMRRMKAALDLIVLNKTQLGKWNRENSLPLC